MIKSPHFFANDARAASTPAIATTIADPTDPRLNPILDYAEIPPPTFFGRHSRLFTVLFILLFGLLLFLSSLRKL